MSLRFDPAAMSSPPVYEYPRWALPAFGGLLVLTFVYFYFGEVVSSNLTLLNVYNTYWVSLQWSKTLPLFGYLVILLGRFGGATQGLVLSAEVVSLAFGMSTYYLLLKVTHRWEAGVVGAVITTASPVFLSAAQDASYSVLLGLAILFPALELGRQTADQFSEGRLLLLALLSLGVALAEPVLGLVLALSLGSFVPKALRSGNGRFAVGPALAAAVSAVGLFAVEPGPDLAWGTQSSVFLLLAAATAMMALYFNWKEGSDSALTLGGFSVAAAAASFLMGTQYVIFGLLLLSSTLLLNVRKFSVATVENGTRFVHVDGTRAAALVFILLILAADLGTSVAASRASVNGYATLATRYGNPELFQAMAWLNQNTPAGSAVLSEYPLSLWVNTLGGRPSLSNFNLNSSYSGFLATYDADTMLNSTYEMRNGFMRVRDWAPVAPQRSPLISVAGGDQYLNVLYVDENHLNLLDPNGVPISVPYGNVTKLSSGFAEVNGSVALQQRYVISGVNVERDVLMGNGAQLTLAYVVTANQTGPSCRSGSPRTGR
jgi:hypothetical protein